MKHMKTVEVPATTKSFVYKVTCDLCRKDIKSESYRTDEVMIYYREGSSYPEGGHGTETKVDICGECFKEVLVPWLESKGAKPEVREWEY